MTTAGPRSSSQKRKKKTGSSASLPRPTPSQAKRNRAARAEKMAKANPGRREAMDEIKRQKQLKRAIAQMQKDALKAEKQRLRDEKKRVLQAEKDLERAEKKRIREEKRQERNRLASEKRKQKKPAKPRVDCFEAPNDLSIAMSRLVPTPAEISQITRPQYDKLRSDMSKRLTDVRVYAQKCSPNYVPKKRPEEETKQRKQRQDAEMAELRAYEPHKLNPRWVKVPKNWDNNVPDEVSEEAFLQAQQRVLDRQKWQKETGHKPKKLRNTNYLL